MRLKTLACMEDRQAILRRLKAFDAQAQRRWGSMSAGGAVCHLALAFEMAIGAKPCAAKSGFLERTVVKFGALRVPFRWPHGVQTLPELVEGVPGMIPGHFAQDRNRLLRAFDSFVAAKTFAPAHPIFGAMSQWEWMRWGYLHTDHHLRQFGL